MSLDDGRLLVSATTYDTLEAEGHNVERLARVHPNFRVIALGLPTPPCESLHLHLLSLTDMRRLSPQTLAFLWTLLFALASRPPC